MGSVQGMTTTVSPRGVGGFRPQIPSQWPAPHSAPQVQVSCGTLPSGSEELGPLKRDPSRSKGEGL